MVFAYSGFELMILAASETRGPREDTGIAPIMAGAIVTLIYFLPQLSSSVCSPMRAARSSSPPARAFSAWLLASCSSAQLWIMIGSSMPSTIAASGTAIAVPPLSRTARRIRKSPIAVARAGR
jgi:amino acid transporter